MLRQMKYPEYFRQRVVLTLWNFGFTFSSFVCCFVVLSNNNFNISEIHNKISSNQLLRDRSNEIAPTQYVIGFILLASYYAQNAFREGTKNGINETVINSLLFLVLGIFTYMKG